MSLEEFPAAVADAIRSRYALLIEEAETVKTQYDNEEWSDTKPKPEISETWVRFNILDGESRQVSIGRPSQQRERMFGVAVAQVFGPVGKGDKELRLLAGKIKKIFTRAKTAEGVVYQTPSVIPMGRDGPWYQFNVRCPFYADHVGQ